MIHTNNWPVHLPFWILPATPIPVVLFTKNCLVWRLVVNCSGRFRMTKSFGQMHVSFGQSLEVVGVSEEKHWTHPIFRGNIISCWEVGRCSWNFHKRFPSQPFWQATFEGCGSAGMAPDFTSPVVDGIVNMGTTPGRPGGAGAGMVPVSGNDPTVTKNVCCSPLAQDAFDAFSYSRRREKCHASCPDMMGICAFSRKPQNRWLATFCSIIVFQIVKGFTAQMLLVLFPSDPQTYSTFEMKTAYSSWEVFVWRRDRLLK